QTCALPILFQQAQQRRIVHVVVRAVGRVDLEARNAQLDEGLKLRLPPWRELRDHAVEGVIDNGHARLVLAVGDGLLEGLAGELRGEVNHGRYATGGGGARADQPVVSGLVDARIKLDVRVCIDDARQ